MRVTKENLQDIVDGMTEADKDYLLINNINIINPITRRIGKRLTHYFEVMKDCKHEHTQQNSYSKRSGNVYFTVCGDCGQSWLG